MQGTFIQKVILTLVAAFFASCLVWFYKNIIQKGDEEINKNWRNPPRPPRPIRRNLLRIRNPETGRGG